MMKDGEMMRVCGNMRKQKQPIRHSDKRAFHVANDDLQKVMNK